jgi:hypothetical protein
LDEEVARAMEAEIMALLGTVVTFFLLACVVWKVTMDVYTLHKLSRPSGSNVRNESFTWVWFVEIVPWFGAIMVSAITRLDGLMSPENVFFFGFLVLSASYLRMLIFILFSNRRGD